MKTLGYEDAFQVLLLQAAGEGRGAALFGDSLACARGAVPPFLVGKRFPNVYFEHPLAGKPFLDVTLVGTMVGIWRAQRNNVLLVVVETLAQVILKRFPILKCR